MDRANTERPARNLAVDFYRVSGVILIVLGHWLAGSVTYRDGQFGRQNPLVDMPWTQWLTWIFQAVPVFFLVAGYAADVSWTHRRGSGGFSRSRWVRHRLARVLGPTTVYVALVSAVVVVIDAKDTAGSVLEYAGWAVAMHLWFLAVYLLLVVLTPLSIAAQRRWGLWVPAGWALVVLAIDAANRVGHVPYIFWLNYLFCWGTLFQLGIAWRMGRLGGRRAALLAAVAATTLAVLIWRDLYPVSMIGVPGEAVQNTTPPNIAMLTFACAQGGLAIVLAPVLNRALRFRVAERMLMAGNDNVMALYLWHMIPVVIVAIIGYPAGLLAQPPEGTTAWWLARLEWVAVLGVVVAAELALLWRGRRVFAAPLPTLGLPLGERIGEVTMVCGALLASVGLHLLAGDGFAPDGHFPWTTALVIAVGVVLVAVRPRDADPTPPAPHRGHLTEAA
jgi:fucose 4-O-acetylase-like acetyltransferase